MVKVRLQATRGAYSGPLHCAQTILRQEGVSVVIVQCWLHLVTREPRSAVPRSSALRSCGPFTADSARLSSVEQRRRQSTTLFMSHFRRSSRHVTTVYRPPLRYACLEPVNPATMAVMRVSAQDNPGFPKALAIPAAAGSAGFVLSFILSPFELIKVSNRTRREHELLALNRCLYFSALINGGCSDHLTLACVPQCRMQLGASGMRRYAGPTQCVRQLLAEEGWRGLMRGTTGTLAREVPGNAVFFTVYETLRQNLPGRPTRKASVGVLGVLKDSASAILCGGIAGMVPSSSPGHTFPHQMPVADVA